MWKPCKHRERAFERCNSGVEFLSDDVFGCCFRCIERSHWLPGCLVLFWWLLLVVGEGACILGAVLAVVG